MWHKLKTKKKFLLTLFHLRFREIYLSNGTCSRSILFLSHCQAHISYQNSTHSTSIRLDLTPSSRVSFEGKQTKMRKIFNINSPWVEVEKVEKVRNFHHIASLTDLITQHRYFTFPRCQTRWKILKIFHLFFYIFFILCGLRMLYFLYVRFDICCFSYLMSTMIVEKSKMNEWRQGRIFLFFCFFLFHIFFAGWLFDGVGVGWAGFGGSFVSLSFSFSFHCVILSVPSVFIYFLCANISSSFLISFEVDDIFPRCSALSSLSLKFYHVLSFI